MGQSRSREFFHAAAAALLALLVFSPSLKFGLLLWDDNLAIYDNPLIRDLSWRSVYRIFTDTGPIIRYMPLSHLAWAVLFKFFGLNPLAFHLPNVILHALSSGLLYLVLLRILKRVASAPPWIALIGALFWAVHPLRAEVVSRASNLTYCGSTFFLLLSVLAYLERKDEENDRGWLYWGSVLAMLVSMLFSGMAVATAALLLLLDLYVLRTLPLQPRQWLAPGALRVWREKFPFLAITLLLGAASIWASFHSVQVYEPAPTLRELGIGLRLGRAALIGFLYVWHQLFPGELLPLDPILYGLDVRDFLIAGSLGLFTAITIAAIALRRRIPWILPLWLAHWVLVGPFLCILDRFAVPTDRYAQMDSMLGALLVAWLCALAWNRVGASQRWACGAAFAALLAAYGSFTLPQQMIWRDSVSLFEYSSARLTNAEVRLDHQERLVEAYLEKGNLESALTLLGGILRENPGDAHAYELSGTALARSQQWRRAADAFEKAAALRPSWEAYLSLASVLLKLNDSAGALRAFADAEKFGALPDDAEFAAAELWEEKREFGEAKRRCERVLARNPGHRGCRALVGARK